MIVGFLMIVAPARPKYLPIRKQNTVQNHEKEIVRSIDLTMEWDGIAFLQETKNSGSLIRLSELYRFSR